MRIGNSGSRSWCYGTVRLGQLIVLLLACHQVNQDAAAQESSPKGVSEEQSSTIAEWSRVRRAMDVHDFDDLRSFAKHIAEQPYQPQPPLPKPLSDWQYDDYVKVSFRADRGHWWNQGLPFWMETFHRGFVQVDRVDLFTLTSWLDGPAVTERVAFSRDDFEYAAPLRRDEIPDAGHAGVKFVGRFPDRDDAEEMLSFVGSSYFRARSGDCVYGASARGLAIDIAMNRDEEFPDFRSFWVRMPARDDRRLTILALLDSPSATGAYRFDLVPGNEVTRVHVDAELYLREPGDAPERKFALAPLTSMWMWGDGLPGPPKDARPSVHDSDGLLIRTDDQSWKWRAFARQPYPSVTSTHVERLLGFGFIQRNRAFYHYDDHNARYDKRPSVWVEPDEAWTDGKIELLEIPGAHEGIDNLAAYWLPAEAPAVGKPYRMSYQVSFFAGDPSDHHTLARATNLSVDRPEDASVDTEIAVQVRFAGPAIRTIPAESPPRLESRVIRGRLGETELTRTEHGDWLIDTTVTPDSDEPVELEFRLSSNDEPVSETFAYLLPPRSPQFVYPDVYTRQESTQK